MSAFYELRQYKVLPGQMENWLKCMQEEIIPFQVSKGMVIAGSFRGETDESVYIWIRRFESEEQRVKLYADVYESAYWKEKIAPRNSDDAGPVGHGDSADCGYEPLGPAVGLAGASAPDSACDCSSVGERPEGLRLRAAALEPDLPRRVRLGMLSMRRWKLI